MCRSDVFKKLINCAADLLDRLEYSCLPNTRRGWNNGIGWKIPKESINVGDGINVLDGKFL